jgi:hypothetical protein
MESKISIRRMILGVNICIYETLKSFVETFTSYNQITIFKERYVHPKQIFIFDTVAYKLYKI